MRRHVFALFLLAAVGEGCTRAPEPPPPAPTFAKDVAPILFAKCASCHHTGELAPFPLLEYRDAARWSEAIAIETQARVMPPWLPSPNTPEFLDVRRLSGEEIDVLQRWHRAGAPMGEPADLPKVPQFTTDWQLGPPGAIASVARPFVLQPGPRDITRNIVMRVTLPAAKFVRAVEFRTGGAPIHHAVIRVDRTSSSRQRDGEDGQAGFEGMGSPEVQDPDGHFIGWTPGRGPILSPEGLPWRIERGSDLVVELHLVPGKRAATVQPTVALYFTDVAPARTPVFVKMGSKAIDIPVGQTDYVVSNTYVLPSDVELLSVYPHAHFLGKRMMVTATRPDGAVQDLLTVPQWNFRWQQDYRYSTAVRLPRGTRITMRYTYDNSAKNPANPQRPPQPVYFGPRSIDEMASLGMQFLTATAAAGDAMVAEFEQRETVDNIAAGQAAVRRNPADAEGQLLLGGSYVDAGRPADALAPLEAAVRLSPRSAGAHNYLGGALMSLGRVAESIDQLRQAASLSPRDERYQTNLGNAFHAAGRDGDAAAAFQRALALNADFEAAHANLGLVFFGQRRFADALRHFQRAAELAPDSATAQSDLGAALAAVGRTAEAIDRLRLALRLQPGYPPAVENLARLERRQ